ncbi:hypothetical protein ACFWWC_49555, partial [Streptomyces sp. NPDC058642]|uniref:hypothetical protein n=1 Tax=Streptomyces sp. NPDC058642 TaxID=3346572 RepID=UPI00365CA18D
MTLRNKVILPAPKPSWAASRAPARPAKASLLEEPRPAALALEDTGGLHDLAHGLEDAVRAGGTGQPAAE